MIFGTVNFFILYKIFKYKFQFKESAQLPAIVHTLLVYFMPLNFTFQFLFYTETTSIFTILLLYYRVVPLENKGLSSVNVFAGVAALLMR